MRAIMSDLLPNEARIEAEFDLKAAREECGERLRNQMSFAEKALAAMLLANGGALIAMFTFIGNTAGKSGAALKFSSSLLWLGFSCFSVGVALVLAAHFFAFLSQFSFYNQSAEEMWRHQRTLRSGVVDTDMTKELATNKTGNAYMFAGIGLLVLALICFIAGSASCLAGVLPA